MRKRSSAIIAAVLAAGADDAAASYRKALTVKPGDPAASLGLGRIMLRRDPHEAERLFRAALASRPDDAVLLANLGVALDLQERHVEAQAAYRCAQAVARRVAPAVGAAACGTMEVYAELVSQWSV